MKHTLTYLKQRGLISKTHYEQLLAHYINKPISIFWHVRVLLYLGIMLFTTGVGILIYENIETIGHFTLIALVGLAGAGCLAYCFKYAPKFSIEKVIPDSPWLDYILLLGVLLLLAFEGYLQFQYNVFGHRYGLATIIPAIGLFYLAYRFDNIGLLSMGITFLASWLGLSLTPKSLLLDNDFSSVTVVQTGLILTVALIGLGFITYYKNIKKHFDFTYYNFGFHLGAVAILTAAFSFDFGPLWILLLVPLLLLARWYALQNHSFYFVVCAFLYGYIALSYLIIKGIFQLDSDLILWGYILMAYFIGTAIYAIKFLKSTHQNMSKNARL